MKNIENISKIVENILKKYPDARNSDDTLYFMVCENMSPGISRKSFLDVTIHRNEYGIPKYETVRRSRQKLQAKNPKYRAKESVTDARFENWKKVMEYVGE